MILIVEYPGGTQAQAFAAIAKQIWRATGETLGRVRAPTREAAAKMMLGRIAEASDYRGRCSERRR